MASRLAVALCVLLVAAEAWAAKRVAVLAFDGRGAADAQGEVEDLVTRDGTVISSSAVKRSQKRLGVRRLDESGMARVAADLGADAFIEGALTRVGRRYTLLVTVHEGRTGAVTDTLAVSMRAPRMDRDSKADLAEKLLPALAKIAALAADEPLDITPPPAGRGRDVDTEEAPLGGAGDRPPPPPPDDEVGPPMDSEIVVPVDELGRHRYARFAAVDVELGVSAVRRQLSFTYASQLTAAQRPNGYSGGVVPSLTLTGELYPLSFGKNPGTASGIGLGFVVDKVILLKSKLATKEYATSQMKLGADLRFRYNFGHKATLPTLKVIAGFSRLDFTIERGMDDIDLPNVSYTAIELGAAVRLPLGTPTAAIYLDGRYLMVLDAGEIQDPTFYGPGGVLGLNGDAGFELQFLRRGVLKVGVRYERIAYDFDGTGMRSNNRDGNASTQDVGGALDQYLSGYVTAGYLF